MVTEKPAVIKLSSLLMGKSCTDKVPKQRMGLHRLGFEFWVKLAAKEPGVILKFDNFD